MSIIDTLAQLFKISMTKFTDVSKYCATYEAALNRVSNMITADSFLTSKGVEILLQGFMLSNTNDIYAPLIAQYGKNWKSNETSLADTSKAIINYIASLSISTNTMLTSIAPKRKAEISDLCTYTPECVRKRVKHDADKCWERYLQLELKRVKTISTNVESNGNDKVIKIDC